MKVENSEIYRRSVHNQNDPLWNFLLITLYEFFVLSFTSYGPIWIKTSSFSLLSSITENESNQKYLHDQNCQLWNFLPDSF